MQKIVNSISEVSLADFKSFPSYRRVDITNGYIYILRDSTFPGYVKVGMTRDLHRRYKEYNQNKPYNTAEFVAVSEIFDNVLKVEKKILEVLVREIQPIGAKLEWFEAEHEERIRAVVKDAEDHFHLYIPAGDIYANDK